MKLLLIALLFAQHTHINKPAVASVPVPAQTFNNCTVVMTGTSVTITCPVIAPITITSPITFPGATVGKPYLVNLATLANPTGGTPPYKYSAVTLPKWLTLSPTGILSGTPLAVGTDEPITFNVADSSGFVAAVR